ncbi:hypothetical protein DFH09DRAFT_1325392 [Mycena vulgaris]|nr:hypothetical protein DFH09DRAFT_1325392 [Mycena vulgaris]
MSPPALLVLAGLIIVAMVLLSGTLRRYSDLPPGPRGHWLLGNTIPAAFSYRIFEEWTREFGSIFTLRQGTKVIIVVGRVDAALDILDKQSSRLSDRPPSISVGDTLSGGELIILVEDYQDINVVASYYPALQREARRHKLDIVDDPAHHMEHARRESLYTDSTVPSTVWGPGTLAGRAILALGEATLKGLDRIIDRESRAIQKRFEVIRGSVPHLTTDMYSDLIELSRPNLYPQYVLERAADIVFHQIDLGYSAAVSLSVSQLSLAEARLVVFRMFTSRSLDLSDDEYQVGEKTPRKALDLLAMLIQVRPEMTSLCFEVVDYFVRDPHICVLCREHPVIRIHAEESLNIPPICRTPLSELQMRFSQDNMYRWKNWKLLESAGHPAEGRLLHLNAVLLAAVREELCNTPDFFDAAVDLFDFLRCVITGLRLLYRSQFLTAIHKSPNSVASPQTC